MDIFPDPAKRVEANAQHAETAVAADVKEAKSWFSENKEPAVIIAVGFLIVGFILGCIIVKFFR
jgi:hypothetical protein